MKPERIQNTLGEGSEWSLTDDGRVERTFTAESATAAATLGGHLLAAAIDRPPTELRLDGASIRVRIEGPENAALETAKALDAAASA